MDELGWLKAGAFRDADKRKILEHSVMRYHAYVFVCRLKPALTVSCSQLSRSDDCAPEFYAGAHAGHRSGMAYTSANGKSVQH